MTNTFTSELDIAAKDLAGNWKKFECFSWSRWYELEDSENWTIVYTKNRDSGLIDQSNASVIEQALEPFVDGDDPDVLEEYHKHFACGWILGFAIRVYKHRNITEAFRIYHQLMERLSDYPILDEAGYSEREFEATLENIKQAGQMMEFYLPDEFEGEVLHWLSDNNPSAIENRDDQGGHPSDDELIEAFEALGYEATE